MTARSSPHYAAVVRHHAKVDGERRRGRRDDARIFAQLEAEAEAERRRKLDAHDFVARLEVARTEGYAFVDTIPAPTSLSGRVWAWFR
jgi:hypothetical protein